MKEKEVVLKSKIVYQGLVVDIRHDQVLVAESKQQREVIVHPGGVCILALNENDEVLVVEQFRAGAQQFLIELPAGKNEINEISLVTAQRELLEETGYQAKKWQDFGIFYPSPAILDEVIHFYIATDLTYQKPYLDDGEFLESYFLSLKTLKKMILKDEIIDGKTIAFLLKYLSSR